MKVSSWNRLQQCILGFSGYQAGITVITWMYKTWALIKTKWVILKFTWKPIKCNTKIFLNLNNLVVITISWGGGGDIVHFGFGMTLPTYLVACDETLVITGNLTAHLVCMR